MINLTINNKKVTADSEMTILEVAKQNNILIPTLCHLEGIHKYGSCRICVVEVEGSKNLQASCITPVEEGMVVYTNSKRVREARKVIFELILSDHPKDCLNCGRNQSCELQKLGELVQVEDSRFEGEMSKIYIDDSSPCIVRDASKCILCRRCVTVCNEIQGVGILNPQNRGFSTIVSPGDLPLNSSSCTFCGQCVSVCPVDALKEKEETQKVWDALLDSTKKVFIQTAPAIRAALGEEFGYEPGKCVTGKMVSALKEMNFDYVFDTNFGADLTIMEEGTELLKRLTQLFYSEKKITKEQLEKTGFNVSDENPTLPMITSCSPGWINYIEHFYPDQLSNLSSCKSPHMMLGALVKSYFAPMKEIESKDAFVVSVMPCTAKKYEITRPEMENEGYANVDAVVTTRELGKMIKDAGVDFTYLPDREFDNPFGESTGAADIFGVPGGVMEAALRTVYEVVTGEELPSEQLHVKPIQGLEKIKSAEFKIKNAKPEWEFLNGVTLKIAATSGLKGASILLDEIKLGQSPYHFIEVMACPGGCISGGGQPRITNDETRLKRIQALYAEDEGKIIRKSHENQYINKIYKEYLGKPLGHKSHELLHTTYTKKSKY